MPAVAPRSVVDAFDYAALGHLHGAQTLSESVRYSGSPVAMSVNSIDTRPPITSCTAGGELR